MSKPTVNVTEVIAEIAKQNKEKEAQIMEAATEHRLGVLLINDGFFGADAGKRVTSYKHTVEAIIMDKSKIALASLEEIMGDAPSLKEALKQLHDDKIVDEPVAVKGNKTGNAKFVFAYGKAPTSK